MTKQRDPSTFAGALHQAITGIGHDVAADIAGRSVSTVAKWADPDHPSCPPLDICTELDAAYHNARLGRAPIQRVYERRLHRLVTPYTGTGDVLLEILKLQSAAGELSEALAMLRQPSGPQGLKELSNIERVGLLSCIQQLRQQVDELEDAVGHRGEAQNVTPLSERAAG